MQKGKMKPHVCKVDCWHLVAKNSFGDIIFYSSEITEMSQAWDFVKQKKQILGIAEIIWSRHEEKTGKLYDEPIHLKYQDGVGWIKNDIVDWKNQQ